MTNREAREIEKGKSSQKLSIRQLVTVLKELSKVLVLANATNNEMSQAVRSLANVLLRYKDKQVDYVLNNLTLQKPRHTYGYILKTSKTISESEAKDFTFEHIERLLESERLSKPDLISIAVGKFGMSKADLMKTRKEYVVEAIRTAISNLRTIEIIGKQASGRD